MKKLLLLLSLCFLLQMPVTGQTWFTVDLSGVSTINPVITRLNDGNFAAAVANDNLGVDIIMLSSTGDLISVKQTKYPANNITFLSDIREMPSGNLLLTGSVLDSVLYTTHAFAALIDYSSGDAKWATTYVQTPYTKGPYTTITADAFYFLSPEIHVSRIEKFDHNLNTIWCDTVALDTLFYKNPSFSIMACDSFIITTCKNDNDFGYSKISPSGDFEDYVTYFNPGTTYIRMYGGIPLSDGNFIVAGLSGPNYGTVYNPTIAKIGTDGTQIWCVRTDSMIFDRFTRVVELPSGEIAAFAKTSYADQFTETFDGVCIFSASGSLLRSYKFGNPSWTLNLTGVQKCADGILLSGRIANISTAYNTAIFTGFDFSSMCYDTPVSVTASPFSLGTETHHSASSMILNSAPSSVKQTLPDLSVSTGTSWHVCTPVTASAEPADDVISLYPNPVISGESCRISLPSAGDYTVQIADITGKIIATQSISGSSASISTSGLTAGMYLVNVRSAAAVFSHKLIVR